MDFFKQEEIDFLAKYADKIYDPNYQELYQAKEFLMNTLWVKTKYWADNISNKKLTTITKKIWSRRDWDNYKQVAKFKPYTWSKIFEKKYEHTKIYFTIGVDAHNKSLVIKIDCQRESQTALPKEMIDKFDKFQDKNCPETKWLEISYEKIISYNWDKLLFLTNDFISKNINNYHNLINEVWGESEIIERKISRICWNDNSWIYPSGKFGKSKNKNSFENENVFGHEEWLFDINKIVGGYHYAFIEPINKFPDKYKNKIFDILFYTVNSETKKRYWVGRLKKVEIIDKIESDKILKIYKKNLWFDEMCSQLNSVNANVKNFNKWIEQYGLFNLKYKIEDLDIFDSSPIEFDKNENIIKVDRYNLFNLKDELLYENIPENEIEYNNDEILNYNKNQISTDKISRTYKEKICEYENLHSQIQEQFVNYLKAEFGADNIYSEVSKKIDNTRIDIVRKLENNDKYFYEIKSYPNVKTCIRIAIGQLLDYSYWPNKEIAKKLYIVSHKELSFDAEIYLKNIRDKFKIPIFYIYYNLNDNEIIEYE